MANWTCSGKLFSDTTECLCAIFNCLYSTSGRCEGKCKDQKCGGGAYYHALECSRYVKYVDQEIKGCLKANIGVFQDGYITCSLIENYGCEKCFAEVVNHIDANPANNEVSNLEWCSQKQNIQHSQKIGNQNDLPVRAISRTDGRTLVFINLKQAGEVLFDRWWKLRRPHQTKGSRFTVDNWDFEVLKHG